MNATQKKKQLMDTITKVLTPLIDNDYVYLDCKLPKLAY